MIKWFHRLAGPLLGLALMIWLLGKVDFRKLGDSWRHVHYGLLALSIIIVQASYTLRALRWRYLLLATRPIRYRKLYSAMNVGLAANWILPFRIGEMAGAYALSRMEPVPFTTAMASVVADRIFDILWLASALVCVLAFIPLGTVTIPPRLFGVTLTITRLNMIRSAWTMGMLLAGLILFLVLIYFRQAAALRLIRLLFSPFSARLADYVCRAAASFSGGLHVLRNGAHLAMAGLCTLLMWGVSLTGGYVLLACFPFAAGPTFAQVLILTVAVGCSLAVLPNAPGFVGTFHLAIVIGLLLGDPGVDLNLAISFAIIFHLAQFVPAVLLGTFFMWLDNLSLIPRRR